MPLQLYLLSVKIANIVAFKITMNNKANEMVDLKHISGTLLGNLSLHVSLFAAKRSTWF